LQLASPVNYEKQIGLFIPTGAVYILGAPKYVQLIYDNNSFLQDILMIPMGDFQHAMLDSTDQNTDIEQTTLHKMISKQPWCLTVDKTTLPNKIIITTTKTTLEAA